jgi:putative copper resistance protein D
VSEVLLLASTGLHVLALVLGFGMVALGRLLGVTAGPLQGRTAVALVLAALVTGAAQPLLQAVVYFEVPLFSKDTLASAGLVLETAGGRAWLLHLVPLVVLAVAILARSGGERLCFLLWAAALGGLAFQGHAAVRTGLDGLEIRGVMVTHLLAAGAWVGSLPFLVDVASRMGGASLARLMQAYSRLGIMLVAVVLASGVFTAVVQLGGWAGLLGSSYGRILVLKVLLVGGMGAAALLNRNRFTPRLAGEDEIASARAREGLLASMRIEAALGAAVVLLAVVLAGSEPPGMGA